MQNVILDETPEAVSHSYQYQPDIYMRPDANWLAWMWLALLGIPALLLFMIYAQPNEQTHHNKVEQPAAIQEAPSLNH